MLKRLGIHHAHGRARHDSSSSKESVGSRLPDELLQKRDQVLLLLKDLQAAKRAVASFAAMLAHMKVCGSELEPLGNPGLSKLGKNLFFVVASGQSLDCIAQIKRAVELKMKIVRQLDASCRELERMAASRDRAARRMRDRAGSKHESRARQEHERVRWNYEEALSEVLSELDFLLAEAEQGGICQTELKALASFSRAALPTLCDADVQDPATSESDLSLRDFLTRRSAFVRDHTAARLQVVLEEEGVVRPPTPLMRAAITPPMATLVEKQASALQRRAALRPAPQLARASALSRGVNSSSSSSSSSSFCSSSDCRTSDTECPEDDFPLSTPRLSPPPVPAKTFVAEQEPADTVADTVAGAGPAEVMAPEDELTSPASSRDSLFDEPASNDPDLEKARCAREKHHERGFFIGERDGWEEFIDRVSGESFWFNTGTLACVPESPFEEEDE